MQEPTLGSLERTNHNRRNNAKVFVDAFEKGDAKAVAAFWAEDGDYVYVNGRYLQGRSAIKKCV